jgi:hypothetical protein
MVKLNPVLNHAPDSIPFPSVAVPDEPPDTGRESQAVGVSVGEGLGGPRVVFLVAQGRLSTSFGLWFKN